MSADDKTTEERVAELEKQVNWLTWLVNKIVEHLNSAAGQLHVDRRKIDRADANDKGQGSK